MKKLPLIVTIFLFILILPFGASTAKAAMIPSPANYIVNTLGDGITIGCPLACTLRAAINLANGDGADSQITFSVSGTIPLQSSLPAITDAVGMTITGPAGGITIGGERYRILEVNTDAVLTLENLTFRNGGYVDTVSGGAIYSNGSLTINECTFLQNSGELGGAIYSTNGSGSGSVLLVENSAFIDNTATSSGGAIYFGQGSATVSNSTFYNNTAVNGAAITSGSGYAMTINSNTFAHNTTAGATIRSSSTLSLHNNIIADTLGGGVNCSMMISDLGNNIDDGSSCTWSPTKGSMNNTDPQLMPLNNYGGRTKTFALLPGSPAIDAVTYNPTSYPARDQRGVVRPVDGNFDGNAAADIGAFEYVPMVTLPLVIR